MVSIYPDHFCRNMTIFVLEPSQEDCLEGALELRRLRPKRRRRSFRRWDAERQSHPPRTSGETFAAAELFVTQTDPQAPEQKSALNISWCHLSAGSIMRTFLSLHPLSPPHLPVGQGPGTAVKDAAQGKRESVAPRPVWAGPSRFIAYPDGRDESSNGHWSLKLDNCWGLDICDWPEECSQPTPERTPRAPGVIQGPGLRRALSSQATVGDARLPGLRMVSCQFSFGDRKTAS